VGITEIFETMDYGPAPESAALANEWLEINGRAFGHYIDGRWTAPTDLFEVFNPASGNAIARVSQGTATDVDTAVKAARAALPNWKALGGHGRAKFLYAIARQIQKNSRLFAVLETMDNGKPIRETRDIDVPLVARHFTYHAGWAQLCDTEFAGYEPVGVCGQIIPWNFPLMMLAWKIAPALAMGNTVVLKPAEFTPLTALLFASICDHVGLPKGVVNIVTGDGATGKAIVEHPDVDKVAFTGSTEVGRILRKATAGTGKKLTLELGGKSPFVVFEDADLDSAVEGLVDAIWFNQGQVCCAGSRLLVQEGVAEKVYRKVRERMSKLRVGDPLDKAVDLGAIVDRVQLERIASLVKQGVEEGAEIFQTECKFPESGWFYPPTLLTNVGPASTVAQVEIFGPVLVAMTFRTPNEAVELANNTTYGLAASVWTENLSLAHDMAARIKAGTVWVNCTNQFDAAAGFGGYRESGFGREGGKEGLWSYLKPVASAEASSTPDPQPRKAPVDVTHKLYIGGKQARPDGGYSVEIGGVEFARGNRKDVRNAVEAARAAQPNWAKSSGHLRAQILYYLAENLASHLESDAFTDLIFRYAAWCDKFEGVVHPTPMRGVTYALNEPIGVIGAVCPNEPSLEGFLKLVLPCVAMGNAVVALASETNPGPVTDLYRVLDASDLPGGVINILTGPQAEMEDVLAEHDGVDALWHFGAPEAAAKAEALSAGNLKQTWTSRTLAHADAEFLRHATQVKNVWVPMGD